MSRSQTDRDEVSAYIAGRLAENPQVSANAIYRELRGHGIGARRQWVLEEVRGFAEYLGISGRTEQRQREKFAPVRETKYSDALDVVSLARRKGISIERARREFNRSHPHTPISTESIKRHAQKALEKRGGTWHAKPRDRLARTHDVITTTGVKRVITRDSRTASRIGEYMAAVEHYRQTGDLSRLRRFRGKTFSVEKRQYQFETDPERIETLDVAGELDAIETVSG